MASPAEIVRPLPDTLPEDFSEWDGGSSTATVKVSHNGFRPAADYDNVATAPPERPVSSQIRVLATLDGSTPAPPFSATDFRASHYDDSDEEEEDRKRAKKKKLMWSAVVAVPVLLLLVLIPMRSASFRQKLVSVKQSMVNQPSPADADSAANRQKPSPATLLAKTTPAAPNTLKPAPTAQPVQPTQLAITAAPPAADAQADTPQQAEPTMMSNQLAAAKVIPHDINVVAKPEAPPASGFGGNGIDGLNSGGNGVGTVFAGNNKGPKVSAALPTRVALSSGVASGLLIQKTLPVYPAIAKAAQVAGTVVLQATISKAGTIQNLHVLSGPSMLRQSALDAVGTWRYRPYLLNGQPVEVETTVSVVFTTPGK